MSDHLRRALLQRCTTPASLPLVFITKRAPKTTRVRRHATVAAISAGHQSHSTKDANTPDLRPATHNAATGLHRLPTSAILRNLFLGAMISSPILFRFSSAVLDRLANARSSWLNPDANPILRAMVKPLFYDQFCAGTNRREISKTRDSVRRMGFAGVILCYSKEVQASPSNELHSTGKDCASQTMEIECWKAANLETLDMVGAGDWLGLKFTGAGPAISKALMENRPPPLEFVEAMDAICHRAASHGCRVWVDAEQQAFQEAIDRWTIDFMRKHNTNGKALVYNTLQAYLKSARDKLTHQVDLAAKENWTLAIKLVRGAYIANDHRERIHDTKQDTDDSYNSIVADVLSGSNIGGSGPPPPIALFLAGHNPESVSRAWDLIQGLSAEGELKVLPEFGQLQGMADELSCKLLQKCEDSTSASTRGVIPKAYKCLHWGSIQECMQYLLRRLVENKGGADRMKDGMAAYRQELWKRMLGARAKSVSSQ